MVRTHERDSISDYLIQPRRSLWQACRQAGRDKAGARCPDCPLHEICERDTRTRRDCNALAAA